MNRLAAIIEQANLDKAKLPEKAQVIQRLHERAARLESALPQAQGVDEEILISGEIRRIREVIKMLKGNYNAITGYYMLQNKLNNLKKGIEKSIAEYKAISESTFKAYNVALYHYNEYCNIVESLV